MNDMFDVKCALFRVMVAKYFSSCIPVISGTAGEEGGAERIHRGKDQWTTDSNKLGAYEKAFFARGTCPPLRLE